MFALVESGTITQFPKGNKGITIGENQYPSSIYTLWTEAERNAIGIYTVEIDNTNRKDEEVYINTNITYVFGSGKVTGSYGTATAKKLADEDAVDENGDKLKDDKGNQIVNYGLKTFYKNKFNAEATLTDASTISWDVSTSPVAKETLGGNRTLGAGTNAQTGQFVSLLIIQDGTGSRTVTFNAAYEHTEDTAPTLTTTASKGDLFVYRYNGSKFLEVGRNLNLTLS